MRRGDVADAQRTRGWAVALACAVPAVAVAVLLWWLAVSSRDPSLLEDLHIYRGAVLLALSGGSLYDYMGVGPFTYPPFAAVVLEPFARLPQEWLDAVWTVGTFGVAALLCVVLVARLPRDASTWLGERPGVARLAGLASVATIAMITSWPMVINLWLGQISAALTLIVLLDVAGVVPRRFQGALTGIAAAVKLTPLIFIPYFLVTRQWRQAVITSASFAVATGIGFLVHPQDSVAYWTSKIMETSRVGELGVARNHSLLGLLTRWDLGDPLTRGIWLGVGALAVLAALYRAREHFLRGQLVAATVVIGCASLVVSPFSWPHHLVWIVLAGLWLLAHRSTLPVVLGLLVLVSQSLLWPAPPDGAPLAWLREVTTVVAVAISVLGLTRSASPDATATERTPAVPASG